MAVNLLRGNKAPPEYYEAEAYGHLPERVLQLLSDAGWLPEDVAPVSWGEVLEALASEPRPTPSSQDTPESDSEAARLWKQVRQQLQREMSPGSFNTWVHPCRAVAFDGQTLTIAAPSAYARDWLTNRLTNVLKRKLIGITGRPIDVRFIEGVRS